VIELGELKEWRERIEEHGRMLKERLKEIEQRRTDREQEIRLLEGVEEFLASIWEALEEPTFETKQKVLRLVVDRIVVEGSKVVVHHVVPTGPVYLQTERQLVNSTNRHPTRELCWMTRKSKVRVSVAMLASYLLLARLVPLVT
jgi:predicted nuclease with TOPRIM domain